MLSTIKWWSRDLFVVGVMSVGRMAIINIIKLSSMDVIHDKMLYAGNMNVWIEQGVDRIMSIFVMQ